MRGWYRQGEPGRKQGLKMWTLLIPLAIAILFAALDIWPGKQTRSYRLVTKKINRELVGAFGDPGWEWVEKGKGYQNRKGEMTRHGGWVETCEAPFSGTWVAQGAYQDGYREGKWLVTRNGEFFREFVFKKGRVIRIKRERSPE